MVPTQWLSSRKILTGWRGIFGESGSFGGYHRPEMGIAHDSPPRARAGISYALSEASGEGHCGLPRVQLIELATKLLEIPNAVIEAAIDEEITEKSWLPTPLTAIRVFSSRRCTTPSIRSPR